VTGEKFQPLSKEYKKKKQEEGLEGVPNLEESGDMLDSLDFKVTRDGIEIGIFGKDAPKADGHNNLSGDSILPERRFIPAIGEGFTTSIEKEVDRIIADAMAEESKPSKQELDSIETKSGLYNYLSEVFGLTSRSELRLVVLRSDAWLDALSDADLLDLL
jgi:hypothetical protein